MSLSRTRIIAAAPSQIWSLLTDVRTWKKWWPAVDDARSLDLKVLKEGSQFEVFTRWGFLKTIIKSKISLCSTEKALIWNGIAMGVPFEGAYFLRATERGCRVEYRITLARGWRALARTTRFDRRLERTSLQALKGLKSLAERL